VTDYGLKKDGTPRRKPASPKGYPKTGGRKRQTAVARRKSSEPEAYELTQKENEIANSLAKRRDIAAPAVRCKVKCDDNSVEVGIDHPDPATSHILLMQALGTANYDFSSGLLIQLSNVVGKGGTVKTSDLNHAVAMVQGIGPRDETEAMLATQMVAIHNATLMAARRLNHVETLQQQDSASNMVNKLGRTFTSQVEALKKYRSTGEQNIRVQHVNVSEGGQAIVGNVHTGGGGELKNDEQSHEPGHALTQRPALPCDVETNKETLPSASRKR